MKKLLVSIILCFSVLPALTQGYRITINSSNILFNDFSQHRVAFTGFSTDLGFSIKRFSFGIGLRFYIPREYYGTVTFYSFSDYTDKFINVYARGGGFSAAYTFSYDVIKTKTEKYILAPELGIGMFTHTGKINNEPFIRIYGGSDDISIFNFGFSYGIHSIIKIGYLPLFLRLSRTVPLGKREYDDFKASGYFLCEAGIAFPIMKSPPNSQVVKISY